MNTHFELIPKFLKKIVIRFATEHFFDKYGLITWRTVIRKTWDNTNIPSADFGIRFSLSRVASRLYYRMFEYKNPIHIKEIAISVAMECTDNNILIDPRYIIQFSKALRDSWIMELNENDLIKERIEKKTGNKILDLFREEGEVSKEIVEILQNRTSIRIEFFKLYSTDDLNDLKLLIYLPNEYEYIDWVNGPKVEITLNVFKPIQLGFFRIGYDYKLIDIDKSSWVVSISNDNKSEVVEFSDRSRIGSLTEKYIWVK